MNKDQRIVNSEQEQQLFNEIGDRLALEQSSFFKLVLYENLISYYIISIINISVDYSNLLSGTKLITPGDILEKTLGGLITYLKKFDSKNESLADLEEFNIQRNNITHNLLSVFKSLSELDANASKVAVSGQKIVVSLQERLRNISMATSKIVADEAFKQAITDSTSNKG